MKTSLLLTLVAMASFVSGTTAHAEPQYSELLSADATSEDCGRKIAANMIAAGQFKDVRIIDMKCRSQFFKLDTTSCKFTAQDGEANAYRGNIDVKMHVRRSEDPRTGASSYSRYCRIAPSCFFVSDWTFKLRNLNRTVIQAESACVLPTDRITDL